MSKPFPQGSWMTSVFLFSTYFSPIVISQHRINGTVICPQKIRMANLQMAFSASRIRSTDLVFAENTVSTLLTDLYVWRTLLYQHRDTIFSGEAWLVVLLHLNTIYTAFLSRWYTVISNYSHQHKTSSSLNLKLGMNLESINGFIIGESQVAILAVKCKTDMQS